MVSVEIRAPDPAIVPHWDALTRRAGANVFMHPAALCAAAATGLARIHVLLAWEGDKLIGLWGLHERRVAPFFPAFLAAPPYEYAFVASPVIDPDYDVMPAANSASVTLSISSAPGENFANSASNAVFQVYAIAPP